MSKRCTVLKCVFFKSQSVVHTIFTLCSHTCVLKEKVLEGGLQSFVTGAASPSLSLGIHLFICKTCPAVLQLQHSLPPWHIFSSFQLDSDIYVHLLCAIVRHLERLFPLFSLLPHLFPFFSPDKNINADLHATVTKPLMNSWIFGNTQRKNTSAIKHGKKMKECNGVYCF